MMYINLNTADQPKARKVAKVASVDSLFDCNIQEDTMSEGSCARMQPMKSNTGSHHNRNSLMNKGNVKMTERESFIKDLSMTSGSLIKSKSARIPTLSMPASSSPDKA